MADRYPLVANSSTNRIEELAINDNLNLQNNGIVGASTVRASSFIGDLIGTASTATQLTNASQILSGTIPSARLSGFYPIGVTTANVLTDASQILDGVVPRGRLLGEYDINITGTASTANALTDASAISGGILPADRMAGVYNIDITGTAYRSVGAALSITVQNQTDNQNQYILFAKNTNTDASAFVNPGGLTYNPAQNYVGINTNLPDFELDVLGDINASGIVTSNISFASTANIGSLKGLTAIDATSINTIQVSLGLDQLNDLTVIGISTFETLEVEQQTTVTNFNATGVSTIANAEVTQLTAVNSNVTGVSTVAELSVGIGTTAETVISSSRELQNISGIDTVTSQTFRDNLGLSQLDSINVTGLSTFSGIDADTVGVNTITAVSYLGNGAALSGIVTQITAGIGITLSPSNGVGQVQVNAYRPVGKTIFVAKSGDDNNTGLTDSHPKLTIKAAAAVAEAGDTIKVYPGLYQEANPIVLGKFVAVEGLELRNCQVSASNSSLDLFHVNNGCHITDLSFVGPDATGGAAAVAFNPLSGVSSDRFFDGARLIRMNLDYIAENAVGYITSTDYNGGAFSLSTSRTEYVGAVKDTMRATMYNITRGGNNKVVGVGTQLNSDLITGAANLTAFNDMLEFSAGIAKSCITNTEFGTGYTGWTQVRDTGIYADSATGSNQDFGSCANVISAVHTCVGIVTTLAAGGSVTTTYPGNNGQGAATENHSSFSPGVGPITQGPYIRNCTNFIGNSIGLKVDGFNAEPGDLDDIGVTGSMSVDSYTQFNQGGIGVSVSNGAYAQLVSLFTICNDEAVVASSGGQLDLTNSNSSFGTFGLVSRGVGNNGTKSIYTLTGFGQTEALARQNEVVVSGVGTFRPYDGQVVYFDELFQSVQEIRVLDAGSTYTSAPRVTIDSPTGENGITAQATATVENGRVTAITVVTAGSQYASAPNITIDPPTGGGVTATAEASIMAPIYYRVAEATLPSAGITTITLANNLNNTVSAGSTVYFSRLSQQLASSHSFEFIGSGNDILTAKPALGGVPVQENEIVKLDGGEIIFTSTDQAGNFRIGDGIVINQATGSLTGTDFTKALFTTMTPFILALAD
tara:strand:+ start:2731 stop:6024 length:3294 start_codon:yes stop_codon:yes gene_type:complete